MKKSPYIRKSHVLVAVLMFLLPGIAAHAQNTYLSFTQGEKAIKGQNTLPERMVKNRFEKGVDIGYNFTGAYVSKTSVKGSTYNYLHIEGISKMGQPGAPALPVKNEIIAMPRGAKGKIVIMETEYYEYKGYNIHPTLEPARDSKGAPEPIFIKDKAIYGKDAFFPEKIVEITNVGISRGTGLAKTQIRPVQFNPVTKTLRVYTKIKFKLEFSGGKGSFSYVAAENTLHYIKLLKSNVLNSASIPSAPSENHKESATDGKNYIIITHAQYLTQANELADWKRQLGYSVEVVSASSWTDDAVKDSIHGRYHAWQPKPDYFVIIGDHTGSYAVPAETHYTDDVPPEPFITDLYFACMDGDGDWHPDMARGRISVSSASEAQVVVDKIINYEKNPPTTASFYQNGLNCAQYQDDDDDGYADRRFVHTSEDIRDYLQDYQGYTAERIYYTNTSADITTLRYDDGYYSNSQLLPAELRDVAFDWNGGAPDITTAINSGKFYVFHRDHGNTDGSGWAHPDYTTTSMTTLSNGDLLPIVFSMNCHTGGFIWTECFAEKLLRMSNKGAVGVVGATYYSYSGFNDAISLGMLDAIWSDPGIFPVFGSGGTGYNYTIGAGNNVYTMGDVLNQGLYALEKNWDGLSVDDRYEYELFHWFGDPAMKIWTANPYDSVITATHNDSIDCANNTLSITGSRTGALATLVQNNEVIASALLDAGGNGDISYSLSTSGDIILTISKHNCKPYIDTLGQKCAGYPPTVVSDDVFFISDTKAALNGEITNDHGETVTESGFIYSIAPDPLIGDAGITKVQTSPLVTTGTFLENISGLTPSTTYYYKAYAISANGTGYGDEKSFTTLCEVVGTYPYVQNFDSWTTSVPTQECTEDGTVSLEECWQNAVGDDIDWEILSGGTPSSSTGPVSDHSGTGNYLYTEGSFCYVQSGYIHTTAFDLSGLTGADLSFWYHMYGSTMGTLSVQVSTDGGTTWSSDLWSLSGNQGDAWQEANISLDAYTSDSCVLIRFTGITGESTYSDMAIDDITIDGSLDCTPPSTQASAFSVDAANDNDVTVSWTRGNGNAVIVLAKETNAVDTDPNNGYPYTASSVFGSGDEIGTGNFLVYNGTGTTVNLTGLAIGTDYHFALYEYTSADSCYLTPPLTGMATSTGSCSPCYSYGTTTYETSTTRVVFNTINNASAKPADGNSNAYSDYTALSTDIQIDSSYDLTVNVNTDGSFTVATKVWIDWNQDCDFTDPGEEYDLGTASSVADGPTSSSPLSVAVPSSAVIGTVLMRVSTQFNAYATCCETGLDGEVEDYSVNISSSSPVPAATAMATPGCGSGSGSVAVSSDKSGIQTFYLRDNAGGALYDWTGSTVSHEFTGLTDGIYRGQVEKDSEMSPLSDSVILTNDTVTLITLHPQNTDFSVGDDIILTVAADGSNLTYTWRRDSIDLSDDGHVNGVNTIQLNIDSCYEADEGYYDVIISGDCGADTSDIAILSFITGMTGLSAENILIFPNPATGKVYVSGNKLKGSEIIIRNILGELILRRKSVTDKATLNLYAYPKGVYFVRIKNGEMISTSKIVLE